MAKLYPLRPETHQLEELSTRFFTDSMPRNWTCDKPASDYGVDLRVDIFEQGQATGLELLVQLKASKKSRGGESETITIRMSTYNYLWEKLQVVMLVKYIEADNEAYWLLLRDVRLPAKSQKTFSVSIPKENRLSKINWNRIQAVVRDVTNRKTAAQRKYVIENQH